MTHRFFFYTLLVLLPVQLGIHFWPEWAFVLGRRIDYLSPTIYLTDIIILLLVSSWKPKNSPHIRSLPIILFALLNIYFSARWQVSLFAWIKVAEFSLLVWYIKETKPSIQQISRALSIAILYSSLIAIAQHFFQHSIGGPMWLLGERTFSTLTPGIAMTNFASFFNLRSYGTFPHPNVLGGFLAVTLPWITTSPIVFGIGMLALVVTFSRSAWIVFVLGIVYTKTKNLWIRSIGVVAMISLLFSFSRTDESIIVRQQLLQSAGEIWATRPLFGVGLGNFLVALPSFLPSKFIYFLQPVHNIYMLLLTEVGIIGVFLLGYYIWNMRISVTKKFPIIAIALIGLVDHYPLTLQQGQLLFAISVGLLFL